LGGISKGDQQQVWHSLDTCAALDALGSAPKGLSASVAQQRFAEYGPNRLPEPPRRGPLLRFLLQFHHLLIYVLIVAAMITAALAHWVDTVVILLVVLANAVIGFIQEGKAEKAMEAIRQMLAPKASVIRDGQRQSVPSESVVPGDIVLLEAGDRVPADLRLIEAHGLSAQEAMLTGESIPSEKTIAVASESAPIGDRHGVVFSGTLISSGQGKGVAFATGAATEIGRISGMLSAVETLTTPRGEADGRLCEVAHDSDFARLRRIVGVWLFRGPPRVRRALHGGGGSCSCRYSRGVARRFNHYVGGWGAGDGTAKRDCPASSCD